MKHCSKCFEVLPENGEYFYKQKKGKNGFGSECKQCRKSYRRWHHKKNKEKYNQLRKERYQKNKKEKQHKCMHTVKRIKKGLKNTGHIITKGIKSNIKAIIRDTVKKTRGNLKNIAGEEIIGEDKLN